MVAFLFIFDASRYFRFQFKKESDFGKWIISRKIFVGGRKKSEIEFIQKIREPKKGAFR